MSGNVVTVTSTSNALYGTHTLEAIRDPDGEVNLVDHTLGQYFQQK